LPIVEVDVLEDVQVAEVLVDVLDHDEGLAHARNLPIVGAFGVAEAQ
jgi:hypothetical protein